MRQTGGGACRLHMQIARSAYPEERRMEKSLRYQGRREVLQQLAPHYRQASAAQKRALLETFIAATG
jgi:hypothetical protein